MLEKINRLLENNNYSQIKELLKNENIYDIAEILNELDINNLIMVFRLLPKDLAADVFAYLDTDMQVKLIQALSDNEAIKIINDLDADDATDLIDEMPANIVNKIIAKVNPQTRKDINQLLKYPDNSAGSIMSVEYLDLKSDLTVKQALIKIRNEANENDIKHNFFVLDNNRKLIGLVDVNNIIISSETTLISNIMNKKVISTHTLTDQEEVAKIFSKYDLTSMPVVDSENRLVGIITIDDIMDIIKSETTEDIEKMAAIVPTEKPYLKLSIWEIWKSRIPWLLLLMISATFTGKIIQHYENALSAYVILTSFIPMLMDTGGNAGSQSSTTIIRSLSINEINFKDFFKIVWKETEVAIIAGITLAIANYGKLIIVDRVSSKVALIVCLTLIVTVLVSKIVGAILPLVAKKVGFDPAVMASPIITTIIDAVSLIIYFQIASVVLGI